MLTRSDLAPRPQGPDAPARATASRPVDPTPGAFEDELERSVSVLRHTSGMLPDGQGLVTVSGLAARPDGSTFDVLELRDGRVIERYSHPRRVAGQVVGRVWSFRDLTTRCRTERALVRSQEELRALAARLEAIREEERSTVAREIHDELGQALTGLRFDLSALGGVAAEAPPIPRLRALVDVVDGMIDAVRRIASDLRPSILDELGLAAAAEWLAQQFERRFGIRCRVRTAGDDRSCWSSPSCTSRSASRGSSSAT